jgi:hypothetical protein
MALLAGALFSARRNVRQDVATRKGALRLGTVAVFAQLITWALNDPHVGNPLRKSIASSNRSWNRSSPEGRAVRHASGRGTGHAPHWPNSLLGWTRLLRGENRRRTCGPRHAVRPWSGALITLLIFARGPLNHLAGAHYPVVSFGNTRYFEGLHYVIGFLFSLLVFQTVFNAMWCILTIVGLMRLFKKLWIVGIAATVAFTFLAARALFIDAPGLL